MESRVQRDSTAACRLLPAELVALWTTLQSALLGLPGEHQQRAFEISFAVCSVLVALYVWSVLAAELKTVPEELLEADGRVRGSNKIAVQAFLSVAIFAIFVLGVGPPFTSWFKSWGIDTHFRALLAIAAVSILAIVVKMLENWELLPSELFPLSRAAASPAAAT